MEQVDIPGELKANRDNTLKSITGATLLTTSDITSLTLMAP